MTQATDPYTQFFIGVGDDSIVISNTNTTLGYAHYSAWERTINYIFVNPLFRRRGIGRLLVEQCERACDRRRRCRPSATAFSPA